MRILLTNNRLESFSGTELYIRDVARELQDRGHTPMVYSSHLGPLADELRTVTIPVVQDLANTPTPDVIHGQHHFDTMTALLHFSRTPALYYCHGWLPWEETPLRFPRIHRYVAIDRTCRDRLVIEHGIDESRVAVVPNFVDMNRFKPRPPLPVRPKRALVYSNYVDNNNILPVLRNACEQAGIELDAVGLLAGTSTKSPESLLQNYDLVFASGRSAFEALAVGCCLVICNVYGLGPLVTTRNVDDMLSLNFGIRAFRQPIGTDDVLVRFEKYNAIDAAQVSGIIRERATLSACVDRLENLYAEVLSENVVATDHAKEFDAVSAYFRFLAPRIKQFEFLENELAGAQINTNHLRAMLDISEATNHTLINQLGFYAQKGLLHDIRRFGKQLHRRLKRSIADMFAHGSGPNATPARSCKTDSRNP